MTFERTKDYGLVRAIATHPEIWDRISDDFAGPVQQWQPVQDDRLIYVLVSDGEELLGMWMLAPLTVVKLEIHTCLLPHAGYARSRQAADEMAQWIWKNTTCQRLVTIVPRSNRAAAKFAKACGMEYCGCNAKTFMKNGELQDEFMFGLSRPAEAAQEAA